MILQFFSNPLHSLVWTARKIAAKPAVASQSRCDTGMIRAVRTLIMVGHNILTSQVMNFRELAHLLPPAACPACQDVQPCCYRRLMQNAQRQYPLGSWAR